MPKRPSRPASLSPHQATQQGRAKELAALLSTGADCAAPSSDGRTPLLLAAESGRADCIRLLLEAGAPADTTSAREPGPCTRGPIPACAAPMASQRPK